MVGHRKGPPRNRSTPPPATYKPTHCSRLDLLSTCVTTCIQRTSYWALPLDLWSLNSKLPNFIIFSPFHIFGTTLPAITFCRAFSIPSRAIYQSISHSSANMFFKQKSGAADQDDDWLVLGRRNAAAAALPTASPQPRKQPKLRANTDVKSASAPVAMPTQNTHSKTSSQKQPKRLSRLQIV